MFFVLFLSVAFSRILEGSSDEGSSWYVLDEQTSQKFEDRFQRKSYKIESCSRQSNAFRYLGGEPPPGVGCAAPKEGRRKKIKGNKKILSTDV